MRLHYFQTFRIVAILFMVYGLFCLSTHTASAAKAKSLTNCQTHTNVWNHFNVLLQQVVENHECDTLPVLQRSFVFTDIANCNNIPETVNVDAWQTQVPNSSGSRANETGRSGWIIYPTDCSYYTTRTVFGAQLPNPSWGCDWEGFNSDGGPAYDFQCQQIPNG